MTTWHQCQRVNADLRRCRRRCKWFYRQNFV